jgi:glycerol-3-phosphate acyltransferase PlsX
MLAQFAVMGEIYARIVLQLKSPRVGLLSIGEEELKGNELTRTATPLLKNLGINFIGNVEGRDIYTGKADVIVCDGFMGNVALKVSEGLVDIIKHMLQESLEATITRKIGYVLSRAAYTDFKKRVDYSEYGGAPLVGLNGLCIVGHGRSSAKAVANAVTMAVRAVNEDLLGRLSRDLGRIAALPAASHVPPLSNLESR